MLVLIPGGKIVMGSPENEKYRSENEQQHDVTLRSFDQFQHVARARLAAVHDEAPDLMLVDWNMPNMDGITLIRKVRETNKTVPIIMCTTEAEKSRVLEAIKAGVNNYIVKPFTVESLGEKISQTMAKATDVTTAS